MEEVIAFEFESEVRESVNEVRESVSEVHESVTVSEVHDVSPLRSQIEELKAKVQQHTVGKGTCRRKSVCSSGESEQTQ